MPPRTPRLAIPDDDLYRRLEVPSNASFEAIEIAWRALLKRHHPDIAGDDGLETSKRINVAHDWLSDPALRTRYDDAQRRPAGRSTAADAWWQSGGAPTRTARRHVHRPSDLEVRRARFLERVATLTADELDRLSCAESAPLAFVAAIRRFLLPDRLAAVEAIEAEVEARLSPVAWRHLPSRDAVLGAAHDLVLGEFLDEHLGEVFRDRAHERLTRAWEAAVGQPRYGPNSGAVAAFIEQARAITGAELQALEDARVRGGSTTELPWPAGLGPDENDGLRVSSVLAGRDAIAAVEATWPAPSRRVRVALRRTAHALVLRHAFDPGSYETLTAAWRAATRDRTQDPTDLRSSRRGPRPR